MTPEPRTPLDPETRDAVRDLCEGVAVLAHGTVHLLGTTAALTVIEKAQRLAERMDQLDGEELEAATEVSDG